MKRSMFVLLVSLLLISVTARADKVILTNGEWAPYTSVNLKHGGVFTHIVTEAFALSGFETEYRYYPWKRAYKLAKEGEFDGSIAWADTEERAKDFQFSEPVTYNKKVFFHLKNYPFDWQTMDDLKGLIIGATDSYTYGVEFDRASKSGRIQVEFVNRDIQNIRKLMAERIHVFSMDIEVGYSLIHQELVPQQAALVTNHNKPIQKIPVAVAISRRLDKQRAGKIIKALNEGLKALRESGRYDEMIWESRRGGYTK